MKPCYLEFCGINSFSERAEIDFDKLLQFGIFGIFGDTGSGKSTILDCIAFALYGSVSRSRSGSVVDIINYQAEKAYVYFEFIIVYEGSRRKFRVERELKRKNAAQSIHVYEKKGEELIALSEGVRESNALLECIIGLEQKDFEKCIALPQGEFAQFVKAQRSDRLKLISRLFDLEDYGERLVKKTNARFYERSEEYRVALARLEPFAEFTKEKIQTLTDEKALLQEKEQEQEHLRSSLREREKQASALLKLKNEAESLQKRLSVLQNEAQEIEDLEKEIGNLEKAAEAIKAYDREQEAKRAYEQAESNLQRLTKEKQTAEEEYARSSQWNKEELEAKISRFTELRAVARQGELARQKYDSTARSLERARREYSEELVRFPAFSYQEEKEQIEEALAKLGEDDFLSYVEKEGKAALLKNEYAIFAQELKDLTENHQEIAPDSYALIEKYERLSIGEKVDFSQLKARFEERERQKKELNKSLVTLETKNGAYRAHKERLLQLQTEGVRLKKELAEWEEQVKTTQEFSFKEIELSLNLAKEEKKQKSEREERTQKALSNANTQFAAANEKREALKNIYAQERDELTKRFSEGKFSSIDQARALSERFGNAENAKQHISRYKEDYAAVTSRLQDLLKNDYSTVSEVVLNELTNSLSAAEQSYAETVRLLAMKQAELARAQQEIEKKKQLEANAQAIKKQVDLFERLKKLFEGNKFMDFVAEEYLQNVAQNASGRLLSLTDGRYFLRYEGGSVGFTVGDNFNAGKTRGVYTLSGGETFLVSLSLALALSAEICLKSLRPIEFFFLDEGFGTLDERLVDTVMDSLERLKGEHFAIGIISHVEELKHRIEKKLSVEKATEKHGSKIIAE